MFQTMFNCLSVLAMRHNELFPKLKYLHKRFFGGFEKTQVYFIQGPVRNTNNVLPLLFVGSKKCAYEFTSSIYSQIDRMLPLGEFAFRQITRVLPKQFPGVIVVDVEKPFTSREHALIEHGFLPLPNVAFILDLNPPMDRMIQKMSRRRRRDIKELESSDYSYSICENDDACLDHFYWKMYLPYARSRFGNAAQIKTYLQVKEVYKRNGRILFVKKAEEPVAGILFKIVGKKLWAQCFGVYHGDKQYVKDLAGQAALFFLIKWAKGKGLESLDYGLCGPFLQNGLFMHKREWGMHVIDRGNQPVSAIRFDLISDGALSFLQNNPFVLLDSGVMKGVVFTDHFTTKSELEKISSDCLLPGLDSMIVISYHHSDIDEHNYASYPVSSNTSRDSLLSDCATLQKRGFDVDLFEVKNSPSLEIVKSEIRQEGIETPFKENCRKNSALNLHPGEIVEVKSENEILGTLDKSGSLEGMPFTYEMRPHCNRRYRVSRCLNKLVVEGFGTRRTKKVVILDGATCDGVAHGGCKRTCPLLWKEAWLRRPRNNSNGPQSLGEVDLPTLSSSSCYSGPCQSASLRNATHDLPFWDIRQYVWDLSSGAFGPIERLRSTITWLSLRAQEVVSGQKKYPGFRGKLKRTPTVSLDLKPAELVEVKSKDEIMGTLDVWGKNRGLEFTQEMWKYCGRRFRVLKRFDLMINEKDGLMRQISNSVILDGTVCDGKAHKGCQRSCSCFWREIWLRRVGDD